MIQNKHLDAISRYLLTDLKPQTRLDYYRLTNAERSLLRAMCAFSPEGRAVDKPLQNIADRASLSRKQIQRLINGFTRDGQKVPGLVDRGILSVKAKARQSLMKAAVLQINWEALTPDPKKLHILTRRMQGTLPGMKAPADPEEEAGDVQASPELRSIAVVQNPVGIIPPPLDKMSIPSGHRVQTLWTICPEITGKYLESSLSLNSSSGPAMIPAPVQKAVLKPKKSAWETLHPGLMAKLNGELRIVTEARAGLNTSGWSAVDHAAEARDRVMLACERAKIWRNVAENLAKEIYESVLADAARRVAEADA